jgi:adenosylmethionine-8-amino-7-oxononanoate aminotransferase
MNTPDELLLQWDRDHLWHPFTPMGEYAVERPVMIERAEGPWLFDIDGNRYLDGTSSLWCNVHGHRVPELDAALRDQIDRVAHSTLLGIANVPAVRLARKLVELAPPGLSRVFFSDDGATAVEVALKMSFQYWRQRPDPRPGKTRFLALTGAYHGDTLGDVSVGDIGRFHSLFAPLLFPTIRTPAPYCYRCPLGLERPTCGVACATEAERLIREHADELAAVVVEPLVQGAAGMITAPEGYLRRLREVTRECGVLLIADEVAVGFGRTGTMFACSQESVVPDLLCLAKGLTGGYLPLAATLATEEIFAAFLGRAEQGRTFFHGHTYTGSPLGCAVALASIDKLLDGGVMSGLPERVTTLTAQLERLRVLPVVGDIRQRGLMAGIELVRGRETREPFPADRRVGQRVCRMARDRGLMLRPLRDVVVVMPPLTIDPELVGWMGDILFDCVKAVALA